MWLEETLKLSISTPTQYQVQNINRRESQLKPIDSLPCGTVLTTNKYLQTFTGSYPQSRILNQVSISVANFMNNDDVTSISK